MTRRWAQRAAIALLASVVLVVGAGCGAQYPRDTHGSLRAATGGSLRVGVSANPPWTEVGADGEVGGSEARLVESYAASIGATVRWRVGAESVLAEEIDEGQLDVVIGGLTSSSPWTEKMAFTRPYATVQSPNGDSVKLVMATRPGENALLVSLERFLAHQDRR